MMMRDEFYKNRYNCKTFIVGKRKGFVTRPSISNEIFGAFDRKQGGCHNGISESSRERKRERLTLSYRRCLA